jgi:NADH-quinone oxidoreductase subunit J
MITGQLIVFVICGAFALLGAVGLLFFHKAVHAALCLAVVMINLAVIYAALDAGLLAAAQVIVYTGAILMLFLFVIMLVGIDRKESHREPIPGQSVVAVIAGVGTLGLLIFAVLGSFPADAIGLDAANAAEGGNVESLAALIFGKYVFAFEFISALMVIAPIGAMVLAQQARLTPKATQKDRALARIEAYATDGVHPGAKPNSGVTALQDSIAVPSLLPTGHISVDSVSQAMVDRDAVVNTAAVSLITAQRFAELSGEAEPAIIEDAPIELVDTEEERELLK